MDPFMNLFMPLREIPKLLNDAFGVIKRRGWIAVPDRVDPQHTVLAGEPKHDVFFTERIAVPVVAKADDVLTLNHGIKRATKAPMSHALLFM